MDTWLIYKLTGANSGGVFVTDVSNAARTNLMDIRSRQWHPKTCTYFGLQPDMLPEIKSNAEIFGYVKDGPLQGKACAAVLGTVTKMSTYDAESILIGSDSHVLVAALYQPNCDVWLQVCP